MAGKILNANTAKKPITRIIFKVQALEQAILVVFESHQTRRRSPRYSKGARRGKGIRVPLSVMFVQDTIDFKRLV
jgi:hypothetical protein